MMNYRSLLIVCLATLGLAVASWGQADGKIAFISDREGLGDVWIMNADGSDPVNLTQGRHCASPTWSPDGTKIAYISHTLGNGEIWVMDADGSNPQQVTDDSDDSARKDYLSWSADGRSIHYTTSRRTEHLEDGSFRTEFDDFVVGLDGSDPIYVGRGMPFPSRLSPDGTKEVTVVLKDKEDGQARLYIRDTSEDERKAIDLTGLPNVEFPNLPLDARLVTLSTWSPDGMRIAFEFSPALAVQFEIWAVDLDGSNLVELTNGLGGRNPAWQPVVPSATATSVETQSWGRIKSLLSTP